MNDENDYNVAYAKIEDTEKIVNLASQNNTYFPGLCLEDFRQNLSLFIKNKEALVVKNASKIFGVLMFSKKEKELCFLAVENDFRRKGVADMLEHKMESEFNSGDTLKVVTFREGDKKGAAALAFYKKEGFTFKEETKAFGYPCQVLEKEIHKAN